MDELAKRRMDLAESRLLNAADDIRLVHYDGAINRSYYAIFAAMRALLAQRNVEFKKHSAVMSYFHKEYIKTGIFEKKYSKYLQAAFEARNGFDYDDNLCVTAEDAEEQYAHAQEFVSEIRRYLEKEYGA